MEFSGRGVFFVGRILTTNSVSLIDMGIFKFSVFSEVSFGSLYLSRNLSISSKLLNL